MQNSIAHKKSDFKRTDPNTNTNTNSADSISSSTATADNTNNITNSATASNSQEQSACAVALTCPEGNTTVAPPPPTTGTVEVTKVCDLDCPGTDFQVGVVGSNPQPSDFTLQSGHTQAVTLGPGSFNVDEVINEGFEPEFTGDCVGTISAGQTLHCTISNNPVF